jgi:hypothetical protein
MLKRSLLAAMCLVTAVVPAQAEMLYQGLLKFTKASASCTQGPGAGERYTAQFHPASAPGNNNFSSLNFFFYHNAHTYHLLTGDFSTAFKKVSNVSIGWTDFTPDKPSFVLVSKQIPAAIANNSVFVSLIGQVQNPWGNTGQEACIADFAFTGILEKE